MAWHPSGVKRTRLLKYANVTKPVAEIEVHVILLVVESSKEEVVVLGTNPLVIPDTR